MGLRFTRDRGFVFESQTDILSQRVRAILDENPLEAVSIETDGTSYFEAFGASYARMFRTQSALASVVNFLAKNISQCRIRVIRTDEDDVSRPDGKHRVQGLLDRPQPGIPRSRFMRALVGDKAIYDVAAIWKIRENFDPTPNPSTRRVRNSGEVSNLIRLPVPRLTVTDGSLTAPIEFQVLVGRDRINIPAADVIWMPGYSPTSNTVGTPPVEQLRQILAEDAAASKDRENFWKRGPLLNLLFTQEGDRPLSDEAKARFGTAWNNKQGGVEGTDSRGVPLLPLGVKPFPLAIDAESAQYLQGRELTRKEVCFAYGIQPQILGISPANFASIDMFHQMLYQDALAPWMVSIQEELEEQLLREFEEEDSGYYLDFNINAKLQGSFLDQAKIGQQAVGGPWMTLNEFREKFQGLPPVEGGDKIITPLNVVRGGGTQANPQDSAPDSSAPTLVVDDSGHLLELIPGGLAGAP